MTSPSQLEREIKVDLNTKNFLPEGTPVHEPGLSSKGAHSIPELARKYGDGPPKFLPGTFEIMMDTGKQGHKAYADLQTNPVAGKAHLEPEALKALEDYVKGLGVTAVGYTQVNPNYIFEGRSILHDKAIVLTMEMDEEAIEQAPSRETGYEVHYT